MAQINDGRSHRFIHANNRRDAAGDGSADNYAVADYAVGDGSADDYAVADYAVVDDAAGNESAEYDDSLLPRIIIIIIISITVLLSSRRDRNS